MLYKDLVQFEPLDTIVQLVEANDAVKARRLVSTFVFSERMAEQLSEIVFPQLDLESGLDHKGIFIVGNYGTGKSHLLSVISAIAENADLVDSIRSEGTPLHATSAEPNTAPSATVAGAASYRGTRPDSYRGVLRDRARRIAGRFKVIRVELGGVTRRLRDAVVGAIEKSLAEAGTPYTFPAINQLTNNKEALLEAINGFHAAHPDQGILFVLDELLDYLKAQGEREIILDLGFLRELGEVVENAPFRFIAGVQESLFDSPTFQFVSDQLFRVRERFEQIRISREDIEFVVAQRLLLKTDKELAWVTDHLRPYAEFFPHMAERLAQYARLFPIHPSYIEVLENVHMAEKRQVLKTYEAAISRILDTEVPTDAPGLISYDHYWNIILDDASLRAQSGVIEVVAKSEVVAGRVRNAYTRKHLQPMAERIIAALSVQRLTTSDINAPIGVTVEELRDGLCLWTTPKPADALFLASNVETALKEILKTVNGQYISRNEENGQYYLDIHKDIDFDAEIEKRGQFVERTGLNGHFFQALPQLVLPGLQGSVYVSGYRIWSYELPWQAKRVTRPGYFFLGAPDERSTAQPPRDFYVYVLPPFAAQDAPTPEQVIAARADLEDEVIFHFSAMDEEIETILRRYAGASLLAQEVRAHGATYGDKADEHRRRLRAWLQANLTSRLRVSYRGSTRTLTQIFAEMRSTGSQDIEEVIRLVSAHMLEGHFDDEYPQYPAFTRERQPITESARPVAALDAIRAIASGQPNRTQLAASVLDGLGLLDGGATLSTANSLWASHFRQLLTEKPEGHVINHDEVIVEIAGGARPVHKERTTKIEPEWVAVLLVALVYDGGIELNLGRETLDSANVDRAPNLGVQALTDFRFYRRSRQVPVALWEQIFRGLGLQPALIRDEATREDGVRSMLAQIQHEVPDVTRLLNRVNEGISLGNAPLFTDGATYTSQGGVVVQTERPDGGTLARTDVLPQLRETKQFLESLQRINSRGKLTNLQLNGVEVNSALRARSETESLRRVLEAIEQLQPLASWLATAEASLPGTDETATSPIALWRQKSADARTRIMADLRGATRTQPQNGTANLVSAAKQELERLKQEYVTLYSTLHRTYVLGQNGDEKRQRILNSPRREQARALARIDIIEPRELTAWGEAMVAIPTCRAFHDGLLAETPICPHCHFRPSQDSGTPAEARLEALDSRLDALLSQWHHGLQDALKSESARASLASMTATERAPIEQYLAYSTDIAALPNNLVGSVNKALRGLQTVTIDGEAMLDALREGGLPCTVDELRKRFEKQLRKTMYGHDPENTRLTL